jgi:hypothetical protein
MNIEEGAIKGNTAIEVNGESKIMLQRIYSSIRTESKRMHCQVFFGKVMTILS